VSLADDFAAMAKAAFMAGAKSQEQEGLEILTKGVVKHVSKTKIGKKVKRKASAYNRAYAREYAKLKKKHPRTSFSALAKKAHRATRKARK
jgi:hypothetical protein